MLGTARRLETLQGEKKKGGGGGGGGSKLYILPNFDEKLGSKYAFFLIFAKI